MRGRDKGKTMTVVVGASGRAKWAEAAAPKPLFERLGLKRVPLSEWLSPEKMAQLKLLRDEDYSKLPQRARKLAASEGISVAMARRRLLNQA